jgi:HD-like signal output (HDOD) protein/ActR/RegA family two-component response regulator
MRIATPMPATPVTKKRILFVDDEPNVLAGLRNALRPQRHQWDMTFALGPEEALAKIGESSFDVVVSDMRMPHMDGATLLREIKQRQPQAVRMILTGQTEQESVMKSVFIAHMFLSKPCEPDFLKRVIDRACSLNVLLNSEELRVAAGRVDLLPAAPKTYVELNEALTRPNCSVKDVATIIERDVGLCAKILQLVNSAFFGLPRRIVSLHEAVTYLGTLTIKNLAMALQAFSAAKDKCDLSAAELTTLQDHSLLAGQIARQIDTRDKGKAEEAFLAGVLHEVGWLVKVEGNEIVDKNTVDRALLGAYLLGLWGLPHPITETVAFHREPQLITHSTFEIVDAIYIAHHLAAEQMGTARAELDMDHLGRLGVAKNDIDRMRGIAAQLAGSPAP